MFAKFVSLGSNPKTMTTTMKRYVEQRQKAIRARQSMKKRDLAKTLGCAKEKIQVTVDANIKRNTFQLDPLFPDDDEETRWLVEVDPAF
eukprot:1218038-Alexandrium_andersonii.AAC.1